MGKTPQAILGSGWPPTCFPQWLSSSAQRLRSQLPQLLPLPSGIIALNPLCMDSASQPDHPPHEPPSRLSSLLGIVVALLTLTLPVFAIAHFSPTRIDAVETAPTILRQPRL